MTSPQRLPASLTPLAVARNALLNGLEPVAPEELALPDASRCIAGDMPRLAAHPPRDAAVADGFALTARDIVGASSYSPVPLPSTPRWVEAGEAMPDGCDCVVDEDAVNTSGPIAQVVVEAAPGQGVRRAGSDVAAGSIVATEARRILPRDLLIARAAGLTKLRVRRPRLRIVNIPGGTLTANLIAESTRHAGAEGKATEATRRDMASIVSALRPGECDLLITIGGSGIGRHDATVLALAEVGEVMTHGIALQPGRTCAVGRIGATPVIALPGAPDQALAVWWTLALPVLDRLSGRGPR